jgi:hypothetical protein
METIGKVLAVLWFTVFTLFCMWVSLCLLLVWIDGLQAVSIRGSERVGGVASLSVAEIASRYADGFGSMEVTV